MWLCLQNWRRQCCNSHCFGLAFLGPMPDGTKGAVRSHCSTHILNSGQYLSVSSVKACSTYYYCFWRQNRVACLLWKRDNLPPSVMFTKTAGGRQNGNIVLLSFLRDKRGKNCPGNTAAEQVTSECFFVQSSCLPYCSLRYRQKSDRQNNDHMGFLLILGLGPCFGPWAHAHTNVSFQIPDGKTVVVVFWSHLFQLHFFSSSPICWSV